MSGIQSFLEYLNESPARINPISDIRKKANLADVQNNYNMYKDKYNHLGDSWAVIQEGGKTSPMVLIVNVKSEKVLGFAWLSPVRVSGDLYYDIDFSLNVGYGKGFTKDLLGELLKMDIQLLSGGEQSPQSYSVWKSLLDKGLAVPIDTKTGVFLSSTNLEDIWCDNCKHIRLLYKGEK